MESVNQTRSTTTVTRTTRVSESEQAQRVRANLREVQDGLEEVRQKAREEIDAIDRLLDRLDVDGLAGLLQEVTTLETRIDELENRNEALGREREHAMAELDAEKQRLTKLWDAYKAQEDELRKAKRDVPILEEKLADRDRLISQLEDDNTRLQAMETYKERYGSLQRDHERLLNSHRELESDLRQRNETIGQLEAKTEALKHVEDHSKRLKEVERQLSEEKERLAKLYKVYEDTEGKLRGAEDEAARWRAWYDRHRQAFEMVGDAANYPVKTSG